MNRQTVVVVDIIIVNCEQIYHPRQTSGDPTLGVFQTYSLFNWTCPPSPPHPITIVLVDCFCSSQANLQTGCFLHPVPPRWRVWLGLYGLCRQQVVDRRALPQLGVGMEITYRQTVTIFPS